MGKAIHWSRYNQSKIEAGKITFWIPDDLCETWYSKDGSAIFSDVAIEFIQWIRSVYRLTLRAAQGFVESIFSAFQIKLKVPCYTTVCRRLTRLKVTLKSYLGLLEPKSLHVVFDSTGLKVHGEGEWKVRTHGASKRRVWRKLHLGIDENSQQIVSAGLTTHDIHDNEVFNDMLDASGPERISQVTGDGAYDSHHSYEKCANYGINGVFPPRNGAKIKQHGNYRKEPYQRDEHIRHVRRHGMRDWKKASGYHRRSLAETTMFRFKVIQGDTLKSRTINRQAVESFIKVSILNKLRFLSFGS